MRIIFDIDDRDAEELRDLAHRRRTSRAAQIRIAVSTYLRREAHPALHRSFARWPGAPDGLTEQVRLRDVELE